MTTAAPVSGALTRQEMFDRAWRGLEAQGWVQALGDGRRGQARCVYQARDGKRCAWGHVDPSLTSTDVGTVADLWYADRGNTRKLLAREDLDFATELQVAHDEWNENNPEGKLPMREAFVKLAEKYCLTIPT